MQFFPYNAFQKIMRLWDEVHPYNAGQIMKLEGEPDMDRLNEQWKATLKRLGIGRIVMNGARYAHTSWNGEPGERFISVQEVQGSPEAYLTREMNRRFEGPEYCPFRPFVWREEGAYCAGVIYHHWPADSGSIKSLLREWFCAMCAPARCRTAPLRVPSEGIWHHFGPHCAGWSLYEGVLSLLRYKARFSRVRQTAITDHDDFTVKVTMHPQPDGMAEQLLATARRMGYTVNDIFLAAMAETCHRLGANPMTADRDELALGTIVDLRMLAQPESNIDDLFGMFLGFTNAIVRAQDLNDWPTLLRRVATQSAYQKRTRAAQASVLRMGGALAEAHFLTARQWVDKYRRTMPMAAGISNINMNRHWTCDFCPSPLIEYIRIAPTSALLPMTFGTTTTGKKMNITLTRQMSLFDDARTERIVDAFVSRLNNV